MKSIMSKTIVRKHDNPKVGMAVFACIDIPSGATIIESHAEREVSDKNKYTFEIDGKHVIIDSPGILVNHSCSPNCILIKNRYGALDFIASGDIAKDEEITFDYESVETPIIGFTNCCCGANNCRKTMNSAMV